jgi:hypothetical protein
VARDSSIRGGVLDGLIGGHRPSLGPRLVPSGEIAGPTVGIKYLMRHPTIISLEGVDRAF